MAIYNQSHLPAQVPKYPTNSPARIDYDQALFDAAQPELRLLAFDYRRALGEDWFDAANQWGGLPYPCHG